MEHTPPSFAVSTLIFPFALTVLAGLATALGSALAFFTKRTNMRILAWSLAFSAGVMIYLSFVEVLPKSSLSLARNFSPTAASWLTTLGFFSGIILMAIVDALVPKAENPHELRADADIQRLKSKIEIHSPGDHQGLRRMGLFTAITITLHNFPEGIATFLAALEDPTTGIAIAAAVALHNIPEGVSVSVPIFFASGTRRQAFILSLFSGLAEPLGALVAIATLGWLLPVHIMGFVFAGVAGIMVYISLDELLPTARQYGRSHEVIAGIASGMAVIAISLLLLKR
jgi:zinc transporter, ZIP family